MCAAADRLLTHGSLSAEWAPDMPKTLVLGLGNPLLGDDSVGWRVAEAVARELGQPHPRVEVDCLAVGGLGLMERLIGCRCAILIDALVTGAQPPGSLHCLSLDDLPQTAGHLHSAHDASLPVALQAAAALGLPLPQRILVVGIETSSVYDFDERLSPPVAASVPQAIQAVLTLLHQFEGEENLA